MKQNDFYKLEKENDFQDQELGIEENGLHLDIIGDHIYTIHDRKSKLIIAADMGNGNGKVMEVYNY